MYMWNNVITYQTDFSLSLKRLGKSNLDIPAMLLIFLIVLNDVVLLVAR